MQPELQTTGGTVLFLEKVFLKPRQEPIRGVELFNLNLLADLRRLGCRVTAPAHRSWVETVAPVAGDVLPLRTPGGVVGNGLAAAWRLARRRFDVLLLGNVGNGLIPALRLLRVCGVVPRAALIAHREPTRRFVNSLGAMPTAVAAVNAQIAGHFHGGAYGPVRVYYGISAADAFGPGSARRAADGVTRFAVLGQLDNAWKGADTAVAAFRALAADLRSRCELHLASFTRPPAFAESNIRPYRWMPAAEIPDFLRAMDVLIVPSRDEQVMRETFSQAMVQGMLTGLPVLAADLPVLKEKLDAGGGLVFRTVGELAEAMARLARAPDLRRRLGAEARRTALGRYVWSTERFVNEFLFSAGAAAAEAGFAGRRRAPEV